MNIESKKEQNQRYVQNMEKNCKIEQQHPFTTGNKLTRPHSQFNNQNFSFNGTNVNSGQFDQENSNPFFSQHTPEQRNTGNLGFNSKVILQEAQQLPELL